MPALSLLDRLAELTDPRDRKGRQYPLVPLLALALVAILAGNTSVAAIAQFGRLRKHRLGHALGFPHGKMPCANTFTNLFSVLDAGHLDRLIGDWLTDRHADGWDHIALDGKTARGSRDGDTPGVHLLAAYAPQASAVIAQMTVDATTNEHKAALSVLTSPWPPFTHTKTCRRCSDAAMDRAPRRGSNVLMETLRIIHPSPIHPWRAVMWRQLSIRMASRAAVVLATVAFLWSGGSVIWGADGSVDINHPDHCCRAIDCTKVICRGPGTCLNNAWCSQIVPQTNWNKCMPKVTNNCNEPANGGAAFCTMGFCPDNLNCSCTYGVCPAAAPGC